MLRGVGLEVFRGLIILRSPRILLRCVRPGFVTRLIFELRKLFRQERGAALFDELEAGGDLGFADIPRIKQRICGLDHLAIAENRAAQFICTVIGVHLAT